MEAIDLEQELGNKKALIKTLEDIGYVNELHAEMLSVLSLNPFSKHNSASRSVMYAGHFSQHLVVDGAEEKIFQTGVEQEFGKHTFSVKMPENAHVIKVLHRYPKGIDSNSLNHNPETIVIFENDVTKEIDYISIPHYASYHQFFGFRYDVKDTCSLLYPGASIPKDTIFADSPSVGKNSNYKSGVNVNVAFMSIPSVSEDGFMVCEDVLEKFKFRIYETRVVEFGSSQFPLNLYGTVDNYKPFPDIGDNIREDGILMMLRSYDNDLMPVDMSAYDVMEPDFIFDKGVYARGGKGKIVDIKVTSSNNPNKQLPSGMNEHASKYERALIKFHQEIIETEQKLRYERKRKYGTTKLNISPKFHNLIVESLAIVGQQNKDSKQTVNLLYRKAPIDEYRIEFVIEYEMIPGVGNKFTDNHGGKGILVKVEKRENMPVDEDGNSADFVMDSASIIGRMNLGRLYEHYFNSTARDVGKRLKNRIGLQKGATLNKLYNMDPNLVKSCYEYLLGYYYIVSDKQYDFFANQVTEEEKLQHLVDIINDKVYVYYPVNIQKCPIATIKELEASGKDMYQPTFGRVTYVGNSGNRVLTNDKVRIAPLHVMELDKIADDWSSVSSCKLQHFGVPSPTTKSEKFAFPFRNSPVRTIGETEGRIFAGYCGREAIAEMMDRSNNPATQRNIVSNILAADKPSNIDHVVDREYIRLGGSRPLQLIKHIQAAAGFTVVYEPEKQ